MLNELEALILYEEGQHTSGSDSPAVCSKNMRAVCMGAKPSIVGDAIIIKGFLLCFFSN